MVAAVSLPPAPESEVVLSRVQHAEEQDDRRRVPPPPPCPRPKWDLSVLPPPKRPVYLPSPRPAEPKAEVNPEPEPGDRWTCGVNRDGSGPRCELVVYAIVANDKAPVRLKQTGGSMKLRVASIRSMVCGERGWKFVRRGEVPELTKHYDLSTKRVDTEKPCPRPELIMPCWTPEEHAFARSLLRKGCSAKEVSDACGISLVVAEAMAKNTVRRPPSPTSGRTR